MRKFIILLLVLLLAMGWNGACAEGVTVIDGLGREVVFASTPETCVSLTPANTEILYALGVGDSVLAVDSQSDYPPEALTLSRVVGDYYAPNVEAVVALQPDVVFASTTLQRDTIDRLAELGLKVVCNDPTSFGDVTKGIELIADVMGADASALTADIESARDDVAENAADLQGLTVYFALSFGEYGDYTAGPGTFIDDMISFCGADNVASLMPVPWPQYSMEQLILDDPDVILVSDYAGDGSLERQLMSTPGYDGLRAVKNGQVYGVNADITSRPGPRIGEALRLFRETLARAKRDS